MPRRDKFSKKNFGPRFKPKSNNPQTREYHHQNQLRETDVGITEYISKFEGFSAVIKARFSDFQVNEIDLNGQVAKLTDQQIVKLESDNEALNEDQIPSESPLSAVPQNIWENLRELLRLSKKTEPPLIELDVTDVSKEHRTQIHECLKNCFGKQIFANTEEKGGRKIMVFKKFGGKNAEQRFTWPKDKGEYVHFLVYKECLDTLDATLKIASCLKIPAANLAYAGVKDKRSKSTQWFSVRRVEPWKLIIKTKRLHNVKIGNITFKDTPLKLGDLYGNKFRIALRNVSGSDDLIKKSLQSLKEQGFINYYGLQRFGNDKEVPTFSIGIQLLLGNWKEASNIILKPTQSDQPEFDVSKAKKVYAETGDAQKALEQFEDGSKNHSIEYLLLMGLNKGHSNDFVNALSSIPRNTRLLYIHSFQSLVWNFAASKRVEKFGLHVVEGDLVLLENSGIPELCEDNEGDTSETKKPKVKALTAEECSNYTIYDVVLPLPGYDITYPEHLKEFYKETLEKYGLSLEMTKQKVQTYSLSGTYRKLLGQVQNLTWKIMHYSDPNYNLIRSDFEELKGHKEPEDLKNGKYKALVLEFSLHSSSYATMVLREILKTDTSSSSHAKLNNYHIETEKNMAERENEDFKEKVGLLGDSQKYEAFKSIVFCEENTLKRKLDDTTESVDSKVAKTENGN